MCGIIGYIGAKPVVPVLIDGLRRLEYRGYDSAGIAVVSDGACRRAARAGKLANLEEVLVSESARRASTGSATRAGPRTAVRPKRTPTRTATAPAGSSSSTTASSRTISTSSGARGAGPRFVTETDTEVVAHLVEREMQDDGLEDAVRRALLTAARAVRARPALGRRPARRSSRPATARRSSSASATASTSWPPTSPPSSRTRATSSSWTTRRWPSSRATGVHVHRLRRHARSSKPTAARAVGPGHGREGRLQALHAQGDLRAAERRARDGARPRLGRDAARDLPRRAEHLDRRRCARSSAVRSSPAARRGTPGSSASS